MNNTKYKDWQQDILVALHTYKGLTALQIKSYITRKGYKVSQSQVYRFLAKVEGLKSYQVMNGSKLKLYSFNYIGAAKRFELYQFNEYRRQCGLNYMNNKYDEWENIKMIKPSVAAANITQKTRDDIIKFVDDFIEVTELQLKALYDNKITNQKEEEEKEGSMGHSRKYSTYNAISMADQGVYILRLNNKHPVTFVIFERSSMPASVIRAKYVYANEIIKKTGFLFPVIFVGDNIELFIHKTKRLCNQINTETEKKLTSKLMYWDLNNKKMTALANHEEAVRKAEAANKEATNQGNSQ